jgi:HD superfamily phosphohydrolase
LDFIDTIHDPIYGLVPITRIEQQVLATDKMRRTQRIKQLGLVSLTYPGANHSRFEHSIGVMHLTETLLEAFARRGEVSPSPDQIQNIRLAALLHDVGHGPYSHTFEEASKLAIEYDHEEAAHDLIRHDNELRRILGKRVNRVVSFLDGGSIANVPVEIIKGDIGTDRMDYLIRDTYYTGLGHRPDISSLVAALRLVPDRKGRRLAVNYDDVSCVELLASTRYHHFAMIAYRQDCRAKEFLLIKAIAKHVASFPASRRERIFREMFGLDDCELVFGLGSKKNPFMRMLDDGKSLTVLYKIRLGDIRSGLAKYCLYRLHDSRTELREFCSMMTQRVKSLVSREVYVDLNLWKHQVSEVISHRSKYVTATDEFSALLSDESFLLRDIAGAEVLSSTLSVYAHPLSVQKVGELSTKIENERGTLLGGDVLAPFSRDSIARNGFSVTDEVLILLHSLNDYYLELIDSKRLDGPKIVPNLRGITRLTKIANACLKKTGRPRVEIKEFWPSSQQNPFMYSPRLFSLLNALHHLSIIELVYAPDKDPVKRKYTQTYFLRLKARTIRQNLFQGSGRFNYLRAQYMKIFRSGTLNDTFRKFYANQDRKVIGGPSSRA